MNIVFPSSVRYVDLGCTILSPFVRPRCNTPQFGAASDQLDRADSFGSSQPEMPLLLQAVQENDFNWLKSLVAQGVDVDDEWDVDGTTPLLAAAEQNQLKSAAFLIQAGADLNKGDSYLRTPLMVAALEGHYHMVQLLISAGASARLRDEKGKTALTHALENEHIQLAKWLLSVDDSTSALASSELLAFATEAASQNKHSLLKQLLNLPALQPLFWPLAPGGRDPDLPQLESEPDHIIWQCLRKNGLKAFLNGPLR